MGFKVVSLFGLSHSDRLNLKNVRQICHSKIFLIFGMICRWFKVFSLLGSSLSDNSNSKYFKEHNMLCVQKVRRTIYNLFKLAENAGNDRETAIPLLSESKVLSLRIDSVESKMDGLSKSIDNKFLALTAQISALALLHSGKPAFTPRDTKPAKGLVAYRDKNLNRFEAKASMKATPLVARYASASAVETSGGRVLSDFSYVQISNANHLESPANRVTEQAVVTPGNRALAQGNGVMAHQNAVMAHGNGVMAHGNGGFVHGKGVAKQGKGVMAQGNGVEQHSTYELSPYIMPYLAATPVKVTGLPPLHEAPATHESSATVSSPKVRKLQPLPNA